MNALDRYAEEKNGNARFDEDGEEDIYDLPDFE